MSQIRTTKTGDIGAFPGSTFVIDDTPPISQCQEAQISEANCTVAFELYTITKAAAFAGIDLTGKQVTVTDTMFDNGTFNIISNTDDVLTTDHLFGSTDYTTTITVQDPGQAYLTRNESSFVRYIESQSKAHTTKGGQVYTDIPDPPMNGACSDTWGPQ